MNKTKTTLTSSLLGLLMALTVTPLLADDSPVYTRVVEGAYEDVLAAVKDIIKGRGVNIAHTLPASDMLERTGPDFGHKEKVLNGGEIVEFCSASISHKLIRANPENITICPFSVAVYALASDPGKVHLTSRIPYVIDDNSSEAAQEMQDFVKGIIDEAAEW
jgi:uncharacterized protein (DUF302 family)